jgi:hypothetical protein
MKNPSLKNIPPHYQETSTQEITPSLFPHRQVKASTIAPRRDRTIFPSRAKISAKRVCNSQNHDNKMRVR